MESKLNKVKLLTYKKSALPDGSYSGLMSGYTVSFSVNGKMFEAQAEIGVRGLNIPCTVTVTDGNAAVKV